MRLQSVTLHSVASLPLSRSSGPRGCHRRRGTSVPLAGAALLTFVASVLLVCASPGAASAGSGPVDVLYAGSLLDLMQQQVGPAFNEATGYTVDGFSAGSDALASEIKGQTQVGDVFISASPAVNTSLEGSANGDWVSWYAQFASSALLLGYNPSSKFAHALKTKPWYEALDEPGIRVGRTDPATDPKGVLAIEALDQAAKQHKLPALKAIATSTTDVFPETALVGELQAGQLDAGFFYGVEAAASDIKTVPLTGTHLSAQYTITILSRAPHEEAALAFVKFMLSKAGQKILKKNGLTPTTPPKVVGGSSVPGALKATLK